MTLMVPTVRREPPFKAHQRYITFAPRTEIDLCTRVWWGFCNPDSGYSTQAVHQMN